MEIGNVLGTLCHWACAAAGGTSLVLQVKWQDSDQGSAKRCIDSGVQAKIEVDDIQYNLNLMTHGMSWGVDDWLGNNDSQGFAEL